MDLFFDALNKVIDERVPVRQPLQHALRVGTLTIPKPTGPVDLMCELDRWVEQREKEDSKADETWLRVLHEADRLQAVEHERDELLDSSTGLLIVLTLLKDRIAVLGPESVAAVEEFRAAVAEARKQ